MSSSQPDLPPAVLSGVKEALGYILLGAVLAACVFGITILQAYIYFRNSGPDSPRMKAFVAFLFMLDTVTMVLTIQVLYEMVVSKFGAPLSEIMKFPRTTAVENGMTILIGTLTQCSFAHRLWALSKRNVPLVAGIVVLALCSFGPGMVITAHVYTKSDVYSLNSNETRILTGCSSGLSVLCDVIIVLGLRHYLNSKRTGFRRTDSMIDTLIIYAVNRGILTAMCQAGHLIDTIGLPGHFYDLTFGILDGKFYCNTLLATLNAQRSLRTEGNNVMELDTQILNNLDTGLQGSRGSRTTAGRRESSSDSIPTFVLDISTGKTMRKASSADSKHEE